MRVLGKNATFLGVIVLLLGGCVGNVPVQAPLVSTDPFPKGGPPLYELQVGDTIAVKFWGYPELDEELPIRPDGKISLPFVDEVQAAELTPAELESDRYRQRLPARRVGTDIV